jgi:hypothetical protein
MQQGRVVGVDVLQECLPTVLGATCLPFLYSRLVARVFATCRIHLHDVLVCPARVLATCRIHLVFI